MCKWVWVCRCRYKCVSGYGCVGVGVNMCGYGCVGVGVSMLEGVGV